MQEEQQMYLDFPPAQTPSKGSSSRPPGLSMGHTSPATAADSRKPIGSLKCYEHGYLMILRNMEKERVLNLVALGRKRKRGMEYQPRGESFLGLPNQRATTYVTPRGNTGQSPKGTIDSPYLS